MEKTKGKQSVTKIECAMRFIESEIKQKMIRSGEKVWSVRQLAARLQYSVSTVVEAYMRLVALGILESRRGAGYFVAVRSSTQISLKAFEQYNREIDPLWISRQSLNSSPNMLKVGCGWLPTEWMPEQVIRRALKTVAKDSAEILTEYADPLGLLELRQYIARKNEKYNLVIRPEHILLTDSATQAMDLIFRTLLNAGDIILVDDPCYFNFLALTQAHDLKAIAIPFTEHGPELEQFEKALQHRPKLYLTNAGFQNPTGASLSLQSAFRVAKLAEQANLVIVEDDVFSEFEYSPAPRYSALMGLDHVIQIGSFSKTLSASVRCGYIASNATKIEQLIDLKIATHFSSGRLNAEIIYQTLIDSNYQKHIAEIRDRLAKCMQHAIVNLNEIGIETPIVPKGGLFIWCRIPDDIDTSALAQCCLDKGIILAPGRAFSLSEKSHKNLRFNVAQMTQIDIFQTLNAALNELRMSKEKASHHIQHNPKGLNVL